jgi:hypothetical protein
MMGGTGMRVECEQRDADADAGWVERRVMREEDFFEEGH